MKKVLEVPIWAKEGTSIWIEIRDKLELEPIEYLPGDIRTVNKEKGMIDVLYFNCSGTNPVRADRIYKRTGDYKICKNVGDLLELNDAELLKFLETNYWSEEIFTFCAETLISINPYERLEKHEDLEKKEKYISRCKDLKNGHKNLDPHFWAISVRAYINMLTKNEKQAVLISGESGAGKTEGTKRVLNLLISINKNHNEEEIEKKPIETRIYDVNPILEAFGNSKTIRNDNSSRFGKYLTLFFDLNDYSIKGAKIDNYLLEKSRVCRIIDGERNYHIFYSTLKYAPQGDLEKYKIVDKGEKYDHMKFDIINKSKTFNCPKVNDEEFYFDVLDSFRSTGFTEGEINSIFKIIGIIFNLGNIKFDTSKYKEGSVPCNVVKTKNWDNLIELLEADSEDLENSITQKELIIQGQSNFKPLSPTYCESFKISFIQSLYDNMFNWIVVKFNVNLLPKDFDNLITIGLLDIFGFEIFEVNSLEQFCINFTNEKLQSLYITCTFKYECEIFKEEDLSQYLHLIKFKDNDILLKSLDNNKMPPGVFNLIDNTCKLNKDHTYLIKDVMNSHSKSEYIKKPKFKDNIFTVIHTARDVDYTVDQFVEKNKDEISSLIIKVMKNADSITKNIFFNCLTNQEYNEKFSKKEERINPLDKFLGYKFRKNMNELNDELIKCNNHFIRCLKPNEVKKPKYWTNNLVLLQIRYMGILDSIKVRKNSYPYRINYKDFYLKYKDLDRGELSIKTVQEIRSLDIDFKPIVIKFIDELNLVDRDNKVLIGKTKIFMQEIFITDLEKQLEIILKEKIKALKMIKQAYFEKKFKDRIEKLKDDSYTSIQNAKNIFYTWNSKIEYVKFKKFLNLIRKIQNHFNYIKEKRTMRFKKYNINIIERLFLTYKIKQKFYKQMNINQLLYNCVNKFKKKLFFRKIRFSKEIIYNEIFKKAWFIIEKNLYFDNMIRITKIWRTYNCKIANKKSIIILNKKIEKMKINYSANQIQKRIKGFLVRKRFLTLNNSAKKIQGFIRMLWLKLYFFKLKNSIKTIQRFYKKYFIKKNLIENKEKVFYENNLNYFSNINNLEYQLLFIENVQLFNLNNFENVDKFSILKNEKQIYKNINSNQIPDFNPNFDSNKAKIFSVLLDFKINLDTTDIYPQTWANDFNYFCNIAKKNNSNFLHLELGETFTFGITNDLKIYSWGLNFENQLGRKTKTNSDYNKPKIIKTLTHNNIKLLSLGKEHGLCVDFANNLYSWGNNYNYQLGVNSNNKCQSMNVIKKLNNPIKKIKCVGNENYILTENGNLFKWPNYNNLTSIHIPTLLNFDKENFKIINMIFGDNFSLFLTKNKLVYSMGDNSFGQLGVKNINSSNKLVLIETFFKNKEKIISIKCGFKHVIALNNLNKLFVWGLNNKGQIGYTKNKIQFIPKLLNLKDKINNKLLFQSMDTGLFSSYLLLLNKSLIKLGDKISENPITNINYHKINSFLKEKDKYIPIKVFSKYNNYMSLCYMVFLDVRNLKEKKIIIDKIISILNDRWTLNDSQTLLYKEEYLNKYVDNKFLKNPMDFVINYKHTKLLEKPFLINHENNKKYNELINNFIKENDSIFSEKNSLMNNTINLNNPIIFKKQSNYGEISKKKVKNGISKKI